MKRLSLLSIPLLFVALAACGDARTAAEGVVANGTLAVTAQMDQYLRDAQATQDKRDADIQSLALTIKQTADVATQTALIAQVTQAAVATVAKATAEAVAARDQATSAAQATYDQATRSAFATQVAYAPTGTALAHQQETQAASARNTQTAATALAEMRMVQTNTAVAAARETETQAVAQTQTAIQLNTLQAEATRRQLENAGLTLLEIGGGLVVVGGIAALIYVLARNGLLSGLLQTYGPNKNPLVINQNGRGLTIHDPLNATAATTTFDGAGGVNANELPELMRLNVLLQKLAVLYQQAQHSAFPPVPGQPDRQERWKIGPVEHETRIGALPATPTRPRLAAPSLPALETAQAAEETAALPLPAWSLFTSFEWSRQELLIGIGLNGLPLTLNPEADPHMLVAGTSGSGKTRHGLTVLIASALRLGWHVVILNRAGADFGALAEHPAAHLFDESDAPLRWLTAAAREVDRRNTVLREANVSTWGRLPGAAPRVLLVVDELVALAQSAEPPVMRALWNAVAHITSAGRKCGLHLAFATTDPTYKTLGRQGLVARDNCARVAFRLRSQQVAVPGEALELGPRRFLALTSAQTAPLPGAAFAPSDDDLRSLARYATNVTPPPAFLTAPKEETLIELPAASVQPVAFVQPVALVQPPAFVQPPAPIQPPAEAAELERVRAALKAEPNISKRRLAEKVFDKPYAGAYAAKLDRLLARLGATTTTAPAPTAPIFAVSRLQEVVVAE